MLQAIAVCSCICAFCLWCGFISICCPHVVDRVTKLSTSQFRCAKCPKVAQCTGIPNTRISEIRRMNEKNKNKGDNITNKDIVKDTDMKKDKEEPEILSDYMEKINFICDPKNLKSSSFNGRKNILDSYY